MILSAKQTALVKKKTADILKKLFIYIVLLSLTYLLIYPILYMLVTVFRSSDDLHNPSVVWVTRHYTLENIKAAMERMKFTSSFLYSLKLALPSAILQTVSCSLAGYGFARFKFKGLSFLFILLILTIVVPPQTLLIPWYSVAQSMGLLNNPALFWVQSLFGMSLKSGLFIFIFCQFYKGLPKELESAAMLDGCSTLGIFIRIMFPNITPATVTVFFFSFVWHWNENYLTKFSLNTTRTMAYMVENATELLNNADIDIKVSQAMIQSGSLLLLLPTLLLFFLLQRYLREGIARSGIVG